MLVIIIIIIIICCSHNPSNKGWKSAKFLKTESRFCWILLITAHLTKIHPLSGLQTDNSRGNLLMGCEVQSH